MAAMRTLPFALTALCFLVPAAPVHATTPPQGSLQARLAACSPAVVRAADEVLRDPATLREPLMFFIAASSLRLAGEREEAAFLYLAGRLRISRQLLFQQGDRVQLLAVMQMTAGPLVLPSLYLDPAMARRVVRRIIDWDRKTPDPFRDQPAAKTADMQGQLAAIDATLAGFPAQLESNRQEMDRAPAAEAERMVKAKLARQCGPGSLDPVDRDPVDRDPVDRDPVDREAATASIEKQAHALVQTHPLVSLRAAGRIASVDTSITSHDSTGLPQRFVISVHPVASRPFDSLVDVQASVTRGRTLGAVRLSLACVREWQNAPHITLDRDQCHDDPPR